MTPSDLVRDFTKLIMNEAGVKVCWSENDKPLTREQLDQIGKKAEHLFCCQHETTDFDFQRNAWQCRDCGAYMPAEYPEDGAFAAIEQRG